MFLTNCNTLVSLSKIINTVHDSDFEFSSHFHAVIFGEKMNSVSQYVGINRVHDTYRHTVYTLCGIIDLWPMLSIAHTWKERQLCTECGR